MEKLARILIVALLCVPVASCKDENEGPRSDLWKKILQEEAEITQLGADVTACRNRVAALERQERDQQAGQEAFKHQFVGFIMDHKLVTVALLVDAAALNASIDPNNEFSQDAHNIGGVVAFFATIYALAHLDEVTEVAAAFAHADAVVKQYKANIASLDAELVREHQLLNDGGAKLQEEQNSVEQDRKKRDSLKSVYWWNHYI